MPKTDFEPFSDAGHHPGGFEKVRSVATGAQARILKQIVSSEK